MNRLFMMRTPIETFALQQKKLMLVLINDCDFHVTRYATVKVRGEPFAGPSQPDAEVVERL